MPIRRGSTTYTGGSKPLYDYFTYANLYQACASLVPGAVFNIVNPVRAQYRCQSLADAGLLSGPSAQWPQEAMDKLVAYGWQPESSAAGLALRARYLLDRDDLQNAHGRFSVLDNLCGFSFAATDAAGSCRPPSRHCFRRRLATATAYRRCSGPRASTS